MRRLACAIASVTLTLGLVACAPMPQPRPPLPPPFTGGIDPDLAAQADVAAYTEPGPYAAGVTTIEIEPGRKAEVWYPAAPAATVGLPEDVYYIRDQLSPFLDSLLAPGVNPPFATGAYRGVAPSGDGPFPLVLFSHGFASFRLQSTFLTAHLATWGFVVVSPDYFERGLPSFLGDPPAPARPDTEVAQLALDGVERLSTEPGPLQGIADTATFFPIGHSAGGGTSLRLLARPDVSFAIPMSAGVNPDSGSVPAVLSDPGKSLMWMVGDRDGVAAPANVRAGYEYTAGQDALVVVPQSGHNNAFSDICEIGRDQGGLIGLAQSGGLPLPDFIINLARDGCIVPPNVLSPEVWPIVRHFATAALRFHAGLDAEPVGLGSGVVSQFALPPEYQHRP